MISMIVERPVRQDRVWPLLFEYLSISFIVIRIDDCATIQLPGI